MGTRLRLLGLGGAGTAAYASSDSSSGSSFLSDLGAPIPLLKSLFSSGDATARSAEAAQLSASVAATSAAVASLDRQLAAQGAAGSRTVMLLVGVPLTGIAAALYIYGWNRRASAAGAGMKTGLNQLKASIEANLDKLKVELVEKIEVLKDKMTEVAKEVGILAEEVSEVKGDVKKVAEGVEGPKKRMSAVEYSSKKGLAADGVELLVRAVADSPLLANASPETTARLNAFLQRLSSGPVTVLRRLSGDQAQDLPPPEAKGSSEGWRPSDARLPPAVPAS
ncbi:hypothetical protein EMIHUDRAFT_223421 [Emiliania huxleyi CCMP1516]|uniref:DUF1664 domain-containing protein n=2 Tax=Emiliania huxleyi TaxID=2903 RepID=A0A0D3KVS4_EMIH1|nr:hypothetical protein EMIHUDRAFT_223421 [Emiliania huxleyi CCMP1516]EOD39859.1 hypothetical protein EMIHUDRAFT_223421 [Emiliania huxleyi CCMP1516]|eukprot:XP_005792288.1 hypothetical protein EMIHUDRAFT_223421 [Emiliania huxleyi CCMP1516]